MLDSLEDISYNHNPWLVIPIDALFIFCAEHELNYSTSTPWLLAFGAFDVYIALNRETGAVGALYGPLHWGENVVVLRTLN